ncbi:Transferase [Macleaya cordata]|uniref:Transferase n=1 Tax=Macleaya cordata TaxID=56857 RepID=A0A200RCP4_MACCD|nr:Transferase [Macleaya cordata]
MNDMIMKVEVVSRQSIKPSCPTPRHLKTFNLSFLDQLSPSFYVPLILFYEIDHSNKDDDNNNIIEGTSGHRCEVIKKSLAETLTRFYPFAGRVKDNRFVDCNDDGVVCLEARVNNCRLSQLIQHPNVQELEKEFLPFDPYVSETSESSGFINSDMLLAVQVNVFEDCGGMVIGVCFSHKIADACTLLTFIKDWAATARGATEQIKGPDFKLSSLFPPRDGLVGFFNQPTLISREELVTKKFLFGASNIAELKKQSIIIPSSTSANGGSDDVQEYRPTRVEVVSAFIWRCFMDVDQSKMDRTAVRVYSVSYSVNMRTRMVPPLPTNCIGNMETITVALSIINGEGEKSDQYPNLVGKVRDAIKKIDSDHVRELQTTDALLNSMKLLQEGMSNEQTVHLHFSSWCRFPIYESDFGWGKPKCVSTCKLALKNLVYLIDTSSGDGIEAWVSLSKEDMTAFERNEELLAFVS